MPTHDAWVWLPAGLAGAVIGAIFFSGLWWTVSRTLTSGRSALWFVAGLLLRLGVALGGFYVVGAGQWQRLLACLVGFVLARLVVVRWVHGWGNARAHEKREADRAPQS